MSVQILVGDCRDVLATLPAGSVQCCVTSPPYFGLRDYGTATWDGGDPACAHSVGGQVQDSKAPGAIQTGVRPGVDASQCRKCGARRVDSQIGLEQTPDAYVAEMVAVFREVRRVLRDDGTCWLNLGDSYASSTKGTGGPTAKQKTNAGAFFEPRKFNMGECKEKDLMGIPWRVAFALQADGWYLRQDIIWQKPNPMPESVTDRCTKAHEYVFLLSKSARYYYDAKAVAEPSITDDPRRPYTSEGAKALDGRAEWKSGEKRDGGDFSTRNRRSVWPIATQPFAGAHFATMPPELAETCIKAGSSERGQCPHCGAPWARQVESESRPNNRPTGQKHDGTYYAANPGGGVGNDRREKIDRGWAQSCACPAHDPIPQTILDPFGGAGTTALVADRLQRDATIIELNPTYAALARNRINGEAGLFSSVVLE